MKYWNLASNSYLTFITLFTYCLTFVDLNHNSEQKYKHNFFDLSISESWLLLNGNKILFFSVRKTSLYILLQYRVNISNVLWMHPGTSYWLLWHESVYRSCGFKSALGQHDPSVTLFWQLSHKNKTEKVIIPWPSFHSVPTVWLILPGSFVFSPLHAVSYQVNATWGISSAAQWLMVGLSCWQPWKWFPICLCALGWVKVR